MRHKPSFRTTRPPTNYSRHARSILLESNLASLLLLTALLLYSNWCYQGLKKRVHAERAAALAPKQAAGPRSQQAPVPSAASGAGFLFSWGLEAQYRLGRQSGAEADTATPQVTLPQLEVAGIAASRHSLLVTRNGSVWSFGPNDSSGGGGHGSKALAASGQLGRPGSWAPAQVGGALQGRAVTQVAAGRYHSVAVTADGRVYTWGLNDWGQLGRAAEAAPAGADAASGAGAAAQQGLHLSKDERLPRRNRQLQAEGAQQGAAATADAALQPAVSGAPSSVIDAQESSSAGPSCHSGWSCHDGAPGLVQALANVTVVAAKAGRYSTVALGSAGQLWLWGYDGCSTGQLPQQDDAWKPRQVQEQLQGQRVAVFDVGYTFWLAATDDGRLYTCDNEDDGYAGTLPEQRKPNNAGQLGRSGPPHQPRRVLGLLEHKSVVAVAAGREHALVATKDGEVFSFGGGRGVLGRQGSASEPGLVAGALAGQFVRHVAAGEYFSLAATDSMAYGWGTNAYLATGTGQGKDTEIQQPTAVAGPLGTGDWDLHGLAAGYQHALAIADQPGSDAAAKLRASALAAVGSGSSSSQAASVEVVLTAEQKQQQEKYQKEQQHNAAARQPADSSTKAEQQQQPLADTPHTPDAAKQAPLQPAAAAKLQAAADSTSQAPVSAAAEAPTRPPGYPAEYHWSYLARQTGPEARRPHAVWAAWKPSPWHDALAALSPDVFKLLPKQYNTQHKNPCWGGTGPALACLPAFSIIGVSKCGTTDLYHRLTLHKQAILPATNKGPHFWDECPYPPQGPCQAGPSGDFQAYINLFSRAADLIRSRPDAITGEASSNTFTSANGVYLRGFRGATPFAEWAMAAGTNATLPALLREAQPYLRLILMLRDPVSRYYSAFHYYRWWLKEERPPTPDDFHETALKEVQEWKDCVAARSVPDCVRSFKPQQLIKGMYAQFLPDWLRHWPRQQLLVLRYEDYIAALPQHLKAVLAFLDVPEPADAGTLQAMTRAAAQNNKTYAPMRPDTRALLEDFYAPFNAALSAALGDNDERWKWADMHSL